MKQLNKKKVRNAIPIVVLALFLIFIANFETKATASYNMVWDKDVYFWFPNYHAYVRFSDTAYLLNATLSNTKVSFPSLTMTGSLNNIGFSSNANVTIEDVEETELDLGTSGTGTSTTLIYYSVEPSSVEGATSYSYSGGVLTFTVNHNILDGHVIIRWGAEVIAIGLLLLIAGFVLLFLPLGIIFYSRPKIDKIIVLLMISFIGYALLMSFGSTIT
jgi:hypothetical protein